VHLSVCLLSTSRNNELIRLHENFTKDVCLDVDDTVKCWKSLDHEDPLTENFSFATLFVIYYFKLPHPLCRRFLQSGAIYT